MNVNQVASMGVQMEQERLTGNMGVAVLKSAMDQAKMQGEATLKLIRGVDEVQPRYVDKMA